MAKDSKGHGSEKRGMPIEGHPYHEKSNAELLYIQRDAHAAAQNMKGMNGAAEGKYLDQVNDASSVLHYRRSGGTDFSQKRDPSLGAVVSHPKSNPVPIHPAMK